MEAGEPPDDGDERFLGGVLSVGVVARQAPADGMDLVVVAPQQLLERMPVPRLGGPDEPGVVEFAANRTRLLGASGNLVGHTQHAPAGVGTHNRPDLAHPDFTGVHFSEHLAEVVHVGSLAVHDG